MLPVACRRCIHLIAELGLTSNHSAASRRDAPDSTASTTRSRNSKEHGFGIDALQNSNQCHQIRLSKSSRESRFNPAEIRSSFTDDPATRLVASKIIELAQRGVRDAPTLSAMTLKEFKDYD